MTATARAGRVRPGWHVSFVAPLFVVLLATTVVPIVYSVALALGASDASLTPQTPFDTSNFATVFERGVESERDRGRGRPPLRG